MVFLTLVNGDRQQDRERGCSDHENCQGLPVRPLHAVRSTCLLTIDLMKPVSKVYVNIVLEHNARSRPLTIEESRQMTEET